MFRKSLWLLLVVMFCIGLSGHTVQAQESNAIAGAVDDIVTDMASGEFKVDPATAQAAGGILALIAGAGMAMMVFYFALALLVTIAGWKVLSKAGLPGWGILIPIWSTLLLLKAAGKPAWWIAILIFVPIVNIVFVVLASIGLAQKFGKGGGFGIGLFLLFPIFLCILAFGNAVHEDGPDLDESAGPTPAAAVPAAAMGAVGTASGPPAKGMTLFAWLGIIAALCFGALITIQILEYKYYEAGPTGENVWPPETSP